eukprot:gb/GFBE01006023.1/.p1 GENE.gb/GFBE01006023.1/~~gb/GFBE01006023.1/.p1  ORF type:complete len:244 (+),score=45.34 gb/GFBE01006023.1/:1-732(+)
MTLRRMAASAAPGLYERRVYSVAPGQMRAFLDASSASAAARKRVLPGFLGMFQTEIGGDINRLTHFYHFPGGLKEREAVLSAAQQDSEWSAYLAESNKLIAAQTSDIFVESDACKAAAGAPRAVDFSGSSAAGSGVYELRTYQLELGYTTVPKLYDLYATGLPAKMAADTERSGELVFLGHIDVGRLNEVVELWRYDDIQASLTARAASRNAPEWRAAVAGAAELAHNFTTQILRPVSFSPWQ